VTAYIVALCREMRVRMLVAEYEADSQIAVLYRHGLIEAALTEDGDFPAYGMNDVIFVKKATVEHLKAPQRLTLWRVAIHDTIIGHTVKRKDFTHFTLDEFVCVCLGGGVDYVRGVHGTTWPSRTKTMNELRSRQDLVGSARGDEFLRVLAQRNAANRSSTALTYVVGWEDKARVARGTISSTMNLNINLPGG